MAKTSPNASLRHLYHFPLCAFSRKVRILLKEKELPFELITENFWERREKFLALNPAGDLPVLVEDERQVLVQHQALAEYIEKLFPNHPLLGETPLQGVEIRRLVAWFDQKFFLEVGRYILNEKIIRYYTGNSSPDTTALKAAKSNLKYHLDYISYLTRQHRWLAGEAFSLADIAAAAQLSVLDYLNDITWDDYPAVKEWYAIVKSRPSFRPLLSDRIPGFTPPKHYANLDF